MACSISLRHGIHILFSVVMKLPKILLILVSLLSVSVVCSSDSVTLVIFPLESRSNVESLEWIGEGIAISLEKQLQGPLVKVISRDERISLLKDTDLPSTIPLSRASMIRVAQQTSADFVVMGTYGGVEEGLQISVNIYDVKAMKLSGDIVAHGPLGALPQVENELAWQILTYNRLEQLTLREEFTKRARKVPNEAYSYFVQSCISTNINNSIKLLLKSMDLYSDYPETRFLLGRYYYQNGDCLNAMPHFVPARQDESNYFENEFMLGTCCLQQNSLDEAIQTFSQSLAISRSVEAINNLGVAYLLKGDYELALQNFLEAHNLAETDALVAINLAILRYLQGSNSAAYNVLVETAKVHPGNGMLHFLLGIVLRSQGKDEDARLVMSKAERYGIDVEKLQVKDPKNWIQVFSDLSP